jgi:hypothetical protein
VEIAAFNEENSRMVKRFFLNNICYKKSVEDSLGRQFTVWTRNQKLTSTCHFVSGIDVGAKDNDVEIKKVLGKMTPGRKMV